MSISNLFTEHHKPWQNLRVNSITVDKIEVIDTTGEGNQIFTCPIQETLPAPKNGSLVSLKTSPTTYEFYFSDGNSWTKVSNQPGTGTVSGPAMSTDYAIATWDGVSGELLRDNTAVIQNGNLLLETTKSLSADIINTAGVGANLELNAGSGTIQANDSILLEEGAVVAPTKHIANLAPPTDPTHLTNKQYVDAQVSTKGDVNGPASSTDDAIARFDGITGKLIQNSNVIVNDVGDTQINSATPSNSSATGALTVAGGVGIGEDLYVNNDIYGSSLTIDAVKLNLDTQGTDAILSTQAQNLVMEVADPKQFVVRNSNTGDVMVIEPTFVRSNQVLQSNNITSVASSNLSINTNNQGGATNSASTSVSTGTTANGNSGIASLSSGNVSGSGDSGNVDIGSGTINTGVAGNVNINIGGTQKLQITPTSTTTNNLISCALPPTLGDHLTNKTYVDSLETFVSGGGAMVSYSASNVNAGHAFAYAYLGTDKYFVKLTGCYTFTPNNGSGSIRINCGASFNSSIANGDCVAVGMLKNTVSGAETPFFIKRYDLANRIIIDFTGLTVGNAYRLTFNTIVAK